MRTRRDEDGAMSRAAAVKAACSCARCAWSRSTAATSRLSPSDVRVTFQTRASSPACSRSTRPASIARATRSVTVVWGSSRSRLKAETVEKSPPMGRNPDGQQELVPLWGQPELLHGLLGATFELRSAARKRPLDAALQSSASPVRAPRAKYPVIRYKSPHRG